MPVDTGQVVDATGAAVGISITNHEDVRGFTTGQAVTMRKVKIPFTDEELLEIASDPATTPVSPWWLKDDQKVGPVREAVLRFARAVIEASEKKLEERVR